MSTNSTHSEVDTRDKSPSLALPVLGLLLAIVMIGVGMWLAGRRNESLPTAYGRRRGSEAGKSVNGTAVLAELFRRAGHRVTTFGRLSPKLEEADVIVWTPDDFKPPIKEQREFLERWLANGYERTVVYVGRDYDGAVEYWNDVAPHVPATQSDEALRRSAEARTEHEAARSQMPKKDYARWYTARRDEPPRGPGTLSGPWAEGIDTEAARLSVAGQLAIPVSGDSNASDPKVPDSVETLLAVEGAPLVTRVTDPSYGDGQVIVMSNGSLVLNYPLVNHERRKLAARLVNEVGEPGRVVFLESGAGGPKVLEKEPTAGGPSWWEQWPFSAILPHMALVGIVLCLAYSPIFGRPRELPAESPSDFGKHVAALGQLLARTKDQNYAQARLAHYREIAERKSGRSHAKGK
jgi:hypothetical protein